MKIYGVSYKKNTANKNSSVRKTKLNRLIFLSNCAVCDKKKSILLKINNFQVISLKWIKLLTNFYWLETNLHQNCNLKQPGFTYCACWPFTKHRERIIKFRETGYLKIFI